MNIEEIACGAAMFIAVALKEHRKEHLGRHANCVLVHPESFADILADEKMRHYLMCSPPRDDGGVRFCGSFIIPTIESGTPKLINCRNEVIYL